MRDVRRHRRARSWLLVLACAVVVGPSLSAHVPAPEVVAYVHVDDMGLRALVRVPTTLLADAGLPVVPPGYLDMSALDAPARRIGQEVARSLDLRDEHGALAPPASIVWRVSREDDRSFDSTERATAHLSARAETPTPIYWNEAFVDFALEYRPGRAIGRLEARLNGLGTKANPHRTRAAFVRGSSPSRTLLITGPPRRVELDPALGKATSTLAALGFARLSAEPTLLVFVSCLLIPRRTHSGIIALLAAVWTAHATGAVAARVAFAPLSEAQGLLAAVFSSVALVLAAVQNVLEARLAPVRLTAVAFGLAAGLGLSAPLAEALPYAGAFTWAGLVSYEVAVLAGSALVAAAAWLLLVGLRRLPVPAWALVLSASAIIAHEGSHFALAAGRRLVTLDLPLSHPGLATMVHYWPLIALVVTCSVLLATTVVRKPVAWPDLGQWPRR